MAFADFTDDEWEEIGCSVWDAADYLTSEEAVNAYLEKARSDWFDVEVRPFVKSRIISSMDTVNRARQRNNKNN